MPSTRYFVQAILRIEKIWLLRVSHKWPLSWGQML